MPKVKARCNKRSCQARRNLSMHPSQYLRWPTCHMSGCNGKMYVDKYRQRKGKHDHAELCRDDCLPYYHPISDVSCKNYEKYITNHKPSKHSPWKIGESPGH